MRVFFGGLEQARIISDDSRKNGWIEITTDSAGDVRRAPERVDIDLATETLRPLAELATGSFVEKHGVEPDRIEIKIVKREGYVNDTAGELGTWHQDGMNPQLSGSSSSLVVSDTLSTEILLDDGTIFQSDARVVVDCDTMNRTHTQPLSLEPIDRTWVMAVPYGRITK